MLNLNYYRSFGKYSYGMYVSMARFWHGFTSFFGPIDLANAMGSQLVGAFTFFLSPLRYALLPPGSATIFMKSIF